MTTIGFQIYANFRRCESFGFRFLSNSGKIRHFWVFLTYCRLYQTTSVMPGDGGTSSDLMQGAACLFSLFCMGHGGHTKNAQCEQCAQPLITERMHMQASARTPRAKVRAQITIGGMPTSENCLVRAECRPRLGGMPTGRNAEYFHYERPYPFRS